jgi:hypothetical protein
LATGKLKNYQQKLKVIIMSNSKLIHGFSNYKEISSFFQNLAQDMKSNGQCNLGGNALLEKFCKADGISDRRTLKYMFDKIENPFIDVKNLNDLEKILGNYKGDFLANTENEAKIDAFFGNTSYNHFSILNEPTYNDKHKCFYAETPIGYILFGEAAKAPYFSKHINTKGNKYFVTINSNPIAGEDCQLMDDLTLVSSDFEECVQHVKSLINKYMNSSYLNFISDDLFFTTITNDLDITNCIKNHWDNTNGLDWIDEAIIKIIKTIFTFEREISPTLMNKFREHFNQPLHFQVVSYDGETAYENDLGHILNDDGESYLFFKDAINSTSMYECKSDNEDGLLIYIESDDKKIEINVNIDNIEKLQKLNYIPQ